MTDRDMLKQLYLTQLLIIFAAAAAGLFFFEDVRDVLKLWDIRDMRIIWYGVSIAVIVILADMAVMKWFPSHLYDDGGINKKYSVRGQSLILYF